MTTMMPAPAGAEPDAVTPADPRDPHDMGTGVDHARRDVRRMEDALRRDRRRPRRRLAMDPGDPRPARAHPVHQAAGDEAMVCSAAMRETWPGRWHDLLRARVQDVIDALVSHEREIRAMDPGMFARMPSPSLCDRCGNATTRPGRHLA